jgi:hypothetical protein
VSREGTRWESAVTQAYAPFQCPLLAACLPSAWPPVPAAAAEEATRAGLLCWLFSVPAAEKPPTGSHARRGEEAEGREQRARGTRTGNTLDESTRVCRFVVVAAPPGCRLNGRISLLHKHARARQKETWARSQPVGMAWHSYVCEFVWMHCSAVSSLQPQRVW